MLMFESENLVRFALLVVAARQSGSTPARQVLIEHVVVGNVSAGAFKDGTGIRLSLGQHPFVESQMRLVQQPFQQAATGRLRAFGQTEWADDFVSERHLVHITIKRLKWHLDPEDPTLSQVVTTGFCGDFQVGSISAGDMHIGDGSSSDSSGEVDYMGVQQPAEDAPDQAEEVRDGPTDWLEQELGALLEVGGCQESELQEVLNELRAEAGETISEGGEELLPTSSQQAPTHVVDGVCGCPLCVCAYACVWEPTQLDRFEFMCGFRSNRCPTCASAPYAKHAPGHGVFYWPSISGSFVPRSICAGVGPSLFPETPCHSQETDDDPAAIPEPMAQQPEQPAASSTDAPAVDEELCRHSVLERRARSLMYPTAELSRIETLFDVRINQFSHLFDNLRGGVKFGQVRAIQGHLLMIHCGQHPKQQCKLVLKAHTPIRKNSEATLIKWAIAGLTCSYDEHYEMCVALRNEYNMAKPKKASV